MPVIKLPTPHAGQRIIMSQARRFNWLAAGRRWRKTTLGLHTITNGCLNGGAYIWGAPTYDQVRIGWGEFQKAWGGVAEFNQSRMTAELYGGIVYFRSLEKPDNVRGYTADGVVIDEAGFVRENVWLEVLRPMLMDTGGWLWAKGTPKGMNWFYYGWHNAGDDDTSASWQVPALGVEITSNGLVRKPHPLENDKLSFDELNKLYQTTPERIFRQEYLAEFLDDAGGIFRRVMESATAVRLDSPIEGRQYIAGVDVAAQVDFTVISVFDVAAREMVYMDRFNRVEYPVLEARIAAVYERFNLTTMIVESNSIGRPVIDHLRQRGLGIQEFTTTNATKTAIIQGLQSAFEHGEIKILNDPVLVNELQAFEGKQLSTHWHYGAPDGMHDDCVMSLAIAWSGCTVGSLFLW